MEVYIVSDYNWVAYEGGGAENLGVYGSYDAALEGLIKYRSERRDGGGKLPKPEWNEEAKMWEFQMPCEGGDDWVYRIELWTVK